MISYNDRVKCNLGKGSKFEERLTNEKPVTKNQYPVMLSRGTEKSGPSPKNTVVN